MLRLPERRVVSRAERMADLSPGFARSVIRVAAQELRDKDDLAYKLLETLKKDFAGNLSFISQPVTT